MSLTGFLSYSRVNWQQSPSKSTPWNATNLNIMDAGIKNNNDMISNLRDEVTQLNSNMFDKYIITIPTGKKARIHSSKPAGNSVFWGIAFVQGTAGAAAASAIVQGYGSGSNARYHITPILKSSQIIWEYGKDGDMDFFVTNNVPGNSVNFAFYEFNHNGFDITLIS